MSISHEERELLSALDDGLDRLERSIKRLRKAVKEEDRFSIARACDIGVNASYLAARCAMRLEEHLTYLPKYNG